MNKPPTLPSASAADGRRPDGKFAKGNQASRGNPFARRVARLRSALLRAVTPEDMAAIVQSLIAAARGGDVAAARLLLDRCLGQPAALDVLIRLERLEGETDL